MENGYVQKRRRTDAFLYKALFEQLEICRWQDLHVTDLCKRAQVARKTFYRHFDSPIQMLEVWFEQRMQDYLNTVRPVTFYDLKSILHDFFCFWDLWKTQLLILNKARAPWRSLIWRHAQDVVETRSAGAECFRAYSAGGFLALLDLWVCSGCRPEASLMAARAAAQLDERMGAEKRREECLHAV